MSGKYASEAGRLIAEVHQRLELWDRQHPDHHNRAILDRRWESVAATLGITDKAARGKWKNLKDHFRKEYKRCMATESDQDVSRWPYFHSMMFIKDQISHTATTVAANPVYFSANFQYPAGIYPDVVIGGDNGGSDEENYNSPLDCLNIEYDNQNTVQMWKSNEYPIHHQYDNISDDKHFLLSLLPVFSMLSPEKKLKARIAIETSLLNIAYPDLDDKSPRLQDRRNGDDGITPRKSPTKAEKRNRTSVEDVIGDHEELGRVIKKRNLVHAKSTIDTMKNK